MATSRSQANKDWPFSLPLWAMITVALMLLGLLIWFFLIYTLRTINQLSYWTTEGWFVGWGWGLITTFAVGWGLLNMHWAKKALMDLDVIASYSHVALSICCGFGVLGLHWIAYAKSFNERPLIEDPNKLIPVDAPAESLSGPIFGQAKKGKGWFALTCVTCHGPTGEGLNNLAPSLRDSEFLKTADPVAINVLIRRGRPITDPKNKSGKPMPPRGGDATISDQKVADLVAFVMSMHNRTADPEQLSWEGVEAPPPTLCHAGLKINQQNPSVRTTNLMILKAHGIYMLGVMSGSLVLLVGWMRGWTTKRCRPWFAVNTWAWLVASLSWLSVLLILGMIV